MKKKYLKPQVEAVRVQMTSMIAESMPLQSDTTITDEADILSRVLNPEAGFIDLTDEQSFPDKRIERTTAITSDEVDSCCVFYVSLDERSGRDERR